MDDFYSSDWSFSSSWDSHSSSHWDDYSSSHIHSSDPWNDPAWIAGLRPDSPFYSSNDLTDPTNPLSPISPLNPMFRDWDTGSSPVESSGITDIDWYTTQRTVADTDLDTTKAKTMHTHDNGSIPYTPIGIDTEGYGFWMVVIGALLVFFFLLFFT